MDKDAIMLILKSSMSVFDDHAPYPVRLNMYKNLARLLNVLNSKSIDIEGLWIVNRPYGLEKMDVHFIVHGATDEDIFEMIDVLNFENEGEVIFHKTDELFGESFNEELLTDVLTQNVYTMYIKKN